MLWGNPSKATERANPGNSISGNSCAAVPQDLMAKRRGSSPASSYPPDTARYNRPAIPEDSVGMPRQPHTVQQLSGPPLDIGISPPIDVTGNSDFSGYSEPSIAVNPEHPDQIVVHGGFLDWSNGSTNGSLFVSTDGGATWNDREGVNPPPTAYDAGPADTTIFFGAGSRLFGSFLAGNPDPNVPGAKIYTGATNDPSGAFFQWRTEGSPPTAQPTEQIGTVTNDQPWVAVYSYPPVITESPQLNPVPWNYDVYVAYDDLCATGATRVAAGGGALPNFTVTSDNQDGSFATGPVMYINPGHRLAVSPKTVIPNGPAALSGGRGAVSTGFVYSLHQTCSDCKGSGNLTDVPKVKYMLNRTTDQGRTWSLNGSSLGIEVDEAWSRQGAGPLVSFGDVNQLLGGIDSIAVDPNNGVVFVVYGTDVGNFNLLSAARLFYNNDGVMVADPAVRVSLYGVQAALPSVAVAANGTVGVLYDTFDGNEPATGLPAFSAHLAVADGHASSMVFTDYTLLSFLSPCPPGGDQRVWGDYQQMVAVGNKFYGVFAGNGAALGKTTASTDPIFFTADVSNVASLTVSKVLKYPDPIHLSKFNLQIDGTTVLGNVHGSTATLLVNPGNHTVDETAGTQTSLGAFTKVIGGDCTASGAVNLAQGDSKSCTLANYDHYGGCTASQCCEVPGEGTQGCQSCLSGICR